MQLKISGVIARWRCPAPFAVQPYNTRARVVKTAKLMSTGTLSYFLFWLTDTVTLSPSHLLVNDIQNESQEKMHFLLSYLVRYINQKTLISIY